VVQLAVDLPENPVDDRVAEVDSADPLVSAHVHLRAESRLAALAQDVVDATLEARLLHDAPDRVALEQLAHHHDAVAAVLGQLRQQRVQHPQRAGRLADNAGDDALGSGGVQPAGEIEDRARQRRDRHAAHDGEVTVGEVAREMEPAR
jgi:hypothetical protein